MNDVANNFAIDFRPVGYGVVLIATMIAAVTDIARYKVSNRLTVPLIIAGVTYHGLFAAGQGISFAMAGSVIGLGVLLPFYCVGGMGAGDVKLLAGIGAWVGPHDVLRVLLVTALLAGVYSAVVIMGTAHWVRVVRAIPGWVRRPRSIAAWWAERPRVEATAASDERTRRRRLVPMAAMMFGALVTQLLIAALSSPA